MKSLDFSAIVKKILALILIGFYVFSPITVFAAVTQPVSAPISIPIIITPSPSPTPTPTRTPTPTPNQSTISVGSQTVVSGNNITVSWNIPNASATDYIRILTATASINAGPMGISPSNNCNLNNISGTSAIKLGSCSFTSAVIGDLGAFKLAYYNFSNAVLATSGNFTVTAASGGILTASPSAVLTLSPNVKLNLSWNGITNANAKDYINYLNADDFTGAAAGHTYWPGNNCSWFSNNAIAKTSGTCSIETPIFPGRYKLVYRSGNTPVGQPAPILAVSNVVKVASPKPDLIIDAIGVIGTHTVGNKDLVEVHVKNAGNADVNTSVPVLVKMYDAYLNKIYNYYTIIAPVKAGEVSRVRVNITQPYTHAGNYYFTAFVNYTKTIEESDLNNNQKLITQLVTAPKSDLVVSKVNILGKRSVGSTNDIEITVKNQGISATNQGFWTSVRVYNPSWRLVDSFSLSFDKMEANTQITKKAVLHAPYKNAGYYLFVVQADNFNGVAEIIEYNNSNYTYIYVSPIPTLINKIK